MDRWTRDAEMVVTSVLIWANLDKTSVATGNGWIPSSSFQQIKI